MAKGINPVKRISKKEIKEDKLVTTYFEARNYWKQNYLNILKIGGAVLALIILVSFWTSSKRSSEYTASYELGIAMMKSSQGNPAIAADELEQVADRFSGTAAGNEALLFVAQTKRLADQNEEALAAYETYIKKGRKDDYLYPAALL
ncbi:tetratricopeptide repeat protein, partial [bacterium]|nr:tetratricopeptide repeat protein [bacterium]